LQLDQHHLAAGNRTFLALLGIRCHHGRSPSD
jgi:hypothetical protein